MAMTAAEKKAAAARAEKKRRQSARAEATRITQKEKQPYVTAADAAAADAARTMTAEQIAAQYGGNYAAATGTAGMLAPTIATNAANATSMLSGLVGSLPGAGSYDTTSLLAGFADSNAANARLGAMYGTSLAADIGAAGAAGIAAAQGRASERTDRLSSEERELRLKGDVAGSNYLTNLSNILNIRGQRQNLALSKFQLEQAKREEERQGRGRGGSGSGGSGGETEAQRKARLAAEAEQKRQKQYSAALSSSGYSGATVGGGLPSMNYPK
jgi:hypothetical protein